MASVLACAQGLDVCISNKNQVKHKSITKTATNILDLAHSHNIAQY